jgi:chitinase
MAANSSILSRLIVRTPRVLAVVVLEVFLLLAVVPASAGDDDHPPKRLIAYYPDWAKWQVPPYTSDQIPYHKLTHITEAFLLLQANGKGGLYVDPDLIQPALIKKAHAAGVKVMVSIGGADSVQAAAFANIAAHDEYRRKFAHNLRRFLERHGYDGVDIDWEVPNAPDDTQPCILLMQTLRNELPEPRWLISMAIPSDPRGYGTGFDVPALTPLVDFINVMTYDLHGPWTDHDGHNSPLLLNLADPGLEGSLKDSMDLFHKDYGVSKDKLNIGTAFYGYQFDGVSSLWEFCPNYDCSNTNSQDYGTYVKQRINQMGWKRHYDPVAREPYLLQEDPTQTPGFITYDDAASTARKTRYVLHQRNFGGIFMWNLSADYDGQSQDLLDAMYREFARHENE